jgi:hypothetical protein
MSKVQAHPEKVRIVLAAFRAHQPRRHVKLMNFTPGAYDYLLQEYLARSTAG